MLSTELPVEHGQRTASYDTSLVVSGGVDCDGRRNVYDKKPQRYAKDNRTAHLTARSDKSVAHVTNNKRLYSMFCTVEANYCQTRSTRGLFATAELLACSVDDTSFDVAPEIRCSGVSIRYCCYGNHTADSKPI